MAKYVYPAIFTKEENGLYSVDFPDIKGCVTCGDDLADALYMAQDVLAFTLYDYERDNKKVPVPSDPDSIEVPNGSFVNCVLCDTLEYQKRNNNKAVKKTLSIPEWLNELAINAGVNFSQVLQDALKSQLNVE
ncbi:Predicted nuclease of the RNAse H fold, HicB family [Oribacterium sp. KHPX15]|jgi:predicted RNase H-like HicB family nuclease|uniref:type II toxin-antitoxin system HicB family antitoxin n=1 Tax=Oribacterium sp. KHPX15 TaxID=1855342 RepID=UPI000896D9D0|nr:type II toxin-antitoxin system HicB family antitoxin [Oribacterium sp. KHPX15]MBE6004909.1 type II toxin-antitoxin system HicB family antitoxin [Lachnospiraceae bacterium]SEA38464.1 Predicted nuclease of the RNAse H fold, HicB family [Oribacterium sp. KHPX15]